MSRHAISDDVLRITVGIRLEAGACIAQIRSLIDKFASEQRREEQTTETVGFLWIEDIPEGSRADFLSALSALSGPPGYRYSSAAKGRLLSAADIWPARLESSETRSSPDS